MKSDAELVATVLQGDRQSYATLFRRHERSVLALALAVIGDYHLAQDVVQEAFVTAYQKLPTLRTPGSFGAWVRKIARHVAHLNDDWLHVLLRPLFEQWPYVSNVGPMHVLTNQPDLPTGCLRLRYEAPNLRRDWVVDTQRDNICLRKTRYRKSEQSDTWTLDEGHGPVERTDLTQLPTGQWYAQTIRTPSAPNVTNVKVDLITEADMAATAEGDIPTFFSGEDLIEHARQAGAKITFWAR